ncbi:MAG: ABC transporter permease [Bdellovibrionales bacterium]
MKIKSRAFKKFIAHRAAAISAVGLTLLLAVAILAPWLLTHSPYEVDPSQLSVKPFADSVHWLGTDDVGRDLLSRLIFGARLSLGIGFLAVLLSLAVGLPLGLWAGFQGGRVDQVIMRVVDVLMSLPNILLAIVMVAILGPGLSNTIFAISLVALPQLVRVVRSVVLVEREKLYIQAAKSYGATRLRLVLAHILPNCVAPILVQATLGFSDAILNAAALGFLGLGVQAPTPEWGVMLADSRAYLESAWWLVTLPGLCILLSSLAFNLLGDGLRDALDPRIL